MKTSEAFPFAGFKFPFLLFLLLSSLLPGNAAAENNVLDKAAKEFGVAPAPSGGNTASGSGQDLTVVGDPHGSGRGGIRTGAGTSGPTVTGSTVSGNTAGGTGTTTSSGGGIVNSGSGISVGNSTVSGNTASGVQQGLNQFGIQPVAPGGAAPASGPGQDNVIIGDPHATPQTGSAAPSDCTGSGCSSALPSDLDCGGGGCSGPIHTDSFSCIGDGCGSVNVTECQGSGCGEGGSPPIAATSPIAWTSSAPSFVTVANADGTRGQLTGVAPGSSNIGSTYTDQFGTVQSSGTSFTPSTGTGPVTVVPQMLCDIIVTTNPFASDSAPTDGGDTAFYETFVGDTAIRYYSLQPFTGPEGQGTPASGNDYHMDLTERTTWSSSNPAIGTVSGGQLSAVAAGTTSITGSLTFGASTLTDSLDFRVANGVINSISASPTGAVSEIIGEAGSSGSDGQSLRNEVWLQPTIGVTGGTAPNISLGGTNSNINFIILNGDSALGGNGISVTLRPMLPNTSGLTVTNEGRDRLRVEPAAQTTGRGVPTGSFQSFVDFGSLAFDITRLGDVNAPQASGTMLTYGDVTVKIQHGSISASNFFIQPRNNDSFNSTQFYPAPYLTIFPQNGLPIQFINGNDFFNPQSPVISGLPQLSNDFWFGINGPVNASGPQANDHFAAFDALEGGGFGFVGPNSRDSQFEQGGVETAPSDTHAVAAECPDPK